uniref:Uncharacterized protein n=1 Tax=Cacopsylla melanoneura TaxID=428564 RepID=A0A8D8T3U7_9HEMI
MATNLPHDDRHLPSLSTIDSGADQEYVSLEYDYYDLLQKPTKTPPSFDVTEEEGPEEVETPTIGRKPTSDIRGHFALDDAGPESFVVVPEDATEEVDDDDDDDLDILNLEDSAVGSSAASEALEELLNADPCVVETEFLRGRKGKPGVRVKFQDLSKPYVPCVTIGEGNYTKFLHIVRGGM